MSAAIDKSAEGYDPNGLLDMAISLLGLKNDAALSRAFNGGRA